MERELIGYLPEYLRKYDEIIGIMFTEQVEFSLAWDKLHDVRADQFVETATINGVKRWETILGINPKATDTLEERKFRILVKLNEQLPYTIHFLKKQLTTLCGAENEGFRIITDPDSFTMTVQLALSNSNNFQTVEDMLKRFTPANTVVTVSLMYNQHQMLHEYTHDHLTAYTHDQLRSATIA